MSEIENCTLRVARDYRMRLLAKAGCTMVDLFAVLVAAQNDAMPVCHLAFQQVLEALQNPILKGSAVKEWNQNLHPWRLGCVSSAEMGGHSKRRSMAGRRKYGL